MKQLGVGDKIPMFELPDQDGRIYHIEEELGKSNLIIYFYPKDHTPGCTAEACAFRDQHADFKGLNATVIGISADTPETHQKFARKYDLQFKLLSDTNKRVKKLFGISDSLFGLLSSRITFVVDKEGIIRNVFESQINIKKHIQSALESLQSISS